MLLDITRNALQSILYYENMSSSTAATRPQAQAAPHRRGDWDAREQFGDSFEAGMGAEAVKKLLTNLNLEELSRELREQMRQKRTRRTSAS